MKISWKERERILERKDETNLKGERERKREIIEKRVTPKKD